MKKKKILYTIINISMVLLLTFTSISFRPDIVLAMEEPGFIDPVLPPGSDPEPTPDPEPIPDPDPEDDPEDDPTFIDPVPAPDPGPSDDPTFIDPVPAPTPSPELVTSIAVNTTVVSFGEVQQASETVDFKSVIITNTGTATANIVYQLDGTGYELNAPGPMSLAPGQSTTIYVKLKSQQPVGAYTAGLVIIPNGDSTKAKNVGITGQIVNKTPVITYMAVVPGRVTLSPGSSYTFSADVQGKNNPDTRVNWKVQGNKSSATKIDNSGNLTVGSDETATSFQVVITSVQYPDAWEFGIVDVQQGKYSVTTRSNPANGGTTSGGTTVKSGDDVQLLAAPNNGFKFVNWTVDGKAVSSDQKFVLKNVRKNTEVVANFAQTNCYVKVKANHPEGGKITDSANVLYGSDMKLKAKPNSGFEFAGWYEDDERISKKEEFILENITSNREIVAKFERTAYSINAAVYPNQAGVVFGAGNYAKGTNVTLTAKPIDGYVFDGWVYNNDVVSRDSTITIKNLDQDFSVTATFKQKGATVYTINSSVAEGKGKITPSGKNSFVQGDNITYRFTPSEGYMISAVIVDGTSIGAVPNFTFEKLGGPHSISVKFAKLPDSGKTNPSTPADKKSDEETKKEKEQTEKDLEDTFEKPDEDAEGVEQLDPEQMADFYAMTDATGVLQDLDITEEEARMLIREKQDVLLLEKAAESQFLAVSVNNDYSSNARETESQSYFNVASIPNLEDVVDSILTEDEKISCLKGNPIQVNMNIFANNQFQTDDDKKMLDLALKNHMSVGNFFEAVLMKSDSGRTENITNLDVPMQIVLEIPANIKAEGRTFYILRAHETPDGTEFDFLDNESTDPDTIRFTTDRFSSYAICYEGGESTGWNFMKVINILIVGLIILVGVAISVLLIISVKESKRRKARRAHAQKR